MIEIIAGLVFVIVIITLQSVALGAHAIAEDNVKATVADESFGRVTFVTLGTICAMTHTVLARVIRKGRRGARTSILVRCAEQSN